MFEIVYKYYFLLALPLAVIFFILGRIKFNRHKFNRTKAKKIANKINSFEGEGKEAKVFAYLRKIDPFVFEELVLDGFERRGYQIFRNMRYTGDGGIDGILKDPKGSTILVQSKRYQKYINLQHVKDFSLIISKHTTANKGYFVHTGKTGKAVYTVLSTYKNIELISGRKLISLILNI